jgi:hypothetical protein
MNKLQMTDKYADKYEKIETQIVVLAALIIIVLISASLSNCSAATAKFSPSM